jgi:hypothetical protein
VRDESPTEPIEHRANRSLDGGRIVALAPVQKAACDQTPDIAIADFDNDASIPASTPVTPSCCATGTRSVLPTLLYF